MSDTKILDRIRKVLAKAEGTNNAAEAEALMAKVEAMLEEHNFTMLDVAKADSVDPIGTTLHAGHCWASNSWQRHVATWLAELYGCRLVYQQVRNKILFSVSGRESGRVTWQLMLPFICAQVKAEAQKLHAADREAMYAGRPARGTGLGAFERAVGNALTFRILGLVQASKSRDAERVSRGERALVPVDMIQAELETTWGVLRKSRPVSLATSRDAHAAAARVSLHRQTEGAGSTLSIGK